MSTRTCIEAEYTNHTLCCVFARSSSLSHPLLVGVSDPPQIRWQIPISNSNQIMQASYSVPATPLQGVRTHAPASTPSAFSSFGSLDVSVSHSMPTTPATGYSAPTGTATPAAAAVTVTDTQHADTHKLKATHPVKTDPASIASLMQAVAAEQTRMQQLTENIQQLSSAAASPVKQTAQTHEASGAMPTRSPLAPIQAQSTTAPSMHGRPLISMSPSPPPSVVSGAAPLPPLAIQQPTPTPPSHRGRASDRRSSPFLSPLPPIEESGTAAIQNLNDSFASVASEFGSSPIRSADSPGDIPNSPTELRSMVRSQRESMHLAGEYGSQLMHELEQMTRANEVLRAQVAALSEESARSETEITAIKAISEFLQAEALAWNNGDRTGGSAPPSASQITFSGDISSDLAAFQSSLRAQRKHYRDEVVRLVDELDTLNRHAASQQSTIANLTHAQSMWQQLQSQTNTLQQSRDDLEIQTMELNTKLRIQASQHQTIMQMMTEQLAASKEEAAMEQEKIRRAEQQRREALEKHIATLKSQLNSSSSVGSPASVSASASRRSSMTFESGGIDIMVASSGTAARPPRKRVSLANDLADIDDADTAMVVSPVKANTAHDDASESTQPPAASDGDPDLLSSLSSHLTSIMSVARDHHNVRAGWHESESLWFFERARLREVEQESLAILQEERKEEEASIKQLYDAKSVHEVNESLREQLRQSTAREDNLRQLHEQVLTRVDAQMSQLIAEKDSELAALRERLMEPTIAHGMSTPKKAANPAKSELSTPALAASREAAKERRFTPPKQHRRRNRDDLAPHHSYSQPSSPQRAMLMSVPVSVDSDPRVLTGLDAVSSLTHSVLREVAVSRRSFKATIGWVFTIQIICVIIWFILTNGGSAALSDHPIVVQVMAAIIDAPTHQRFMRS